MPDSDSGFELLVIGPPFFEAFVPGGVVPVPGTEVYVRSIPTGLGGALNSATVAAALGTPTAYMYPRTSWVLDGAVAECCRITGLEPITWGGGTEPFVTLVWSDSTDRAFVSSGDWSAFEKCPALPDARWIHVGGLHEYFLLGEAVAAARLRGSMVSTCAGWDPPVLDRIMRPGGEKPDLLFLNRTEAEYLCGSLESALNVLPGRAGSDIVITDGAAGATAVIGGMTYRSASPVVAVVDPTGAGDAFAAAFINGVLRHRDGAVPDYSAILARACAAASRVVGITGGVVTDRSIFDGV